MTESKDPRTDRARQCREFWNDFVVPTARGLESFAWRVVIGGLLITLIFRSLCP